MRTYGLAVHDARNLEGKLFLHLRESLFETLAFCRAGSVAPLMSSDAVLAMEAPRTSELCKLTMGSLSMVGTLKDAS